MDDVELIAQQVARLTQQVESLKLELGDVKNRHAALLEEFDAFRSWTQSEFGKRMFTLERRRVRI